MTETPAPSAADGPDYADVAGNEASARALAESRGFVYWPGGDGPPADWDGGPYLCRDGETYWMCGYDWAHGTNCYNPTASWDRIGYKRARTA